MVCRHRAVSFALLLAAAAIGATSSVSARRNGIVASGCTGCHGNGSASVEISASPAAFEPGDEVTFSVTLRRSDGAIRAGGLYVESPGSGELRAIAGEGLTRVPNDGFTHSAPKAAENDAVTFRFAWRAPATPGGVNFEAYVLAANGDGRSGGDVAGTGRFQATFGCPSETLYYDSDSDGFGNPDFGTIVACAGSPLPERFSRLGTDCNENDQLVHPDASEKCNRKDDDCNGEIDENAEPVELWPDEDGDGYFGTKTGTSISGCTGLPGYAAESGDCAPRDPRIHRDAKEVCNLIDDNCDGRADERIRPQCGVGLCRTESFSCDPADCRPNPARPERCNLLDDDCDGETDEGELCPSAEACLAGACVALGDQTPRGGAPGNAGAGGQSPGAGGSPSSGNSTSGCAFTAGSPDDLPLLLAISLLGWSLRRGRRDVTAKSATPRR